MPSLDSDDDGSQNSTLVPSDGESSDANDSDSDGSTTSSVHKLLRSRYGRLYCDIFPGEYPLVHTIFVYILGGELVTAPVPEDAWVLDIGTGTGNWAIEFANENPRAMVTGNDISPIQTEWVPPGLNFEIDNYNQKWNHRKPFHYIHGRSIGGSIRNYGEFLAKVMENLEPGGWVEIQEFETRLHLKPWNKVLGWLGWRYEVLGWFDKLNKAAELFEKPTDIASSLKNNIIEAGFVNVEEKIVQVPLDSTPLGCFARKLLSDSLEPYSIELFTTHLHIPIQHLRTYLHNVRQELTRPIPGAYWNFHFVIGKRPSAQPKSPTRSRELPVQLLIVGAFIAYGLRFFNLI